MHGTGASGSADQSIERLAFRADPWLGEDGCDISDEDSDPDPVPPEEGSRNLDMLHIAKTQRPGTEGAFEPRRWLGV